MTVLELAKRWAEPPRILVIENDAEVAKAVTCLMSRYECKIDSVAALDAALKAIASAIYDLVFIDTSLAGCPEAVRALKAKAPTTPLLVMTDTTGQWLEEMLQCGTVTLLRKPLDISPTALKNTLSMFKIKALPRAASATALRRYC